MAEGRRYLLRHGERHMELTEGKMTIGRSRHCDLSIQEPTISRKHVFVTVDSGRVALDDLGSSNGTFVNGTRVSGRAELHDGDKLRLGDAELEVEIRGPADREPADRGAADARRPGKRASSVSPAAVAGSAGGVSAGGVSALAPPLGEPPDWEDDESADDGQPTAPVPYADEIDHDALELEDLEASMDPTTIIRRPHDEPLAGVGLWGRLSRFLRSLFHGP